MARFCPWCREPLPSSARSAASCPFCDRPLTAEDGGELREIDLRYEQVEAAQQQRFRQLLAWGSVVTAGISFCMPLLHAGSAIAVPLMVVVHLIIVRVVLVRQARQYLGRSRKVFTRWIARLSFLWIGVPGYGLSVVPVVGVVAAVLTFAGLTTLVHTYTLWSLARERDRLRLTLWEQALLLVLILITLAAFALALALAVLVGWSVAALSELIATHWG